MLNSEKYPKGSTESLINEKLGELIKLCKEDIFTEDFKKSPAFNTEKTELEVLGIIVSKYCEWIGENIKDVAMAAFEDSHYHDANIELIGN